MKKKIKIIQFISLTIKTIGKTKDTATFEKGAAADFRFISFYSTFSIFCALIGEKEQANH